MELLGAVAVAGGTGEQNMAELNTTLRVVFFAVGVLVLLTTRKDFWKHIFWPNKSPPRHSFGRFFAGPQFRSGIWFLRQQPPISYFVKKQRRSNNVKKSKDMLNISRHCFDTFWSISKQINICFWQFLKCSKITFFKIFKHKINHFLKVHKKTNLSCSKLNTTKPRSAFTAAKKTPTSTNFNFFIIFSKFSKEFKKSEFSQNFVFVRGSPGGVPGGPGNLPGGRFPGSKIVKKC